MLKPFEAFISGETRNLVVFNLSARNNPRLSESSESRRSYPLENGSLVLMHPGCQSTLYHGVPEDSSAAPGIRGSFSYRRTHPEPKQPVPPPVHPNTHSSSAPQNLPVKKTTLIAGDSMIRELDTAKLVKNGNKCLKTFKGGAKIPVVRTLIEDFAKSKEAVDALKPDLELNKFSIKQILIFIVYQY